MARKRAEWGEGKTKSNAGKREKAFRPRSEIAFAQVADFWSWLRLGAAGRILTAAYVSEANADWATHAIGLHAPGQVGCSVKIKSKN